MADNIILIGFMGVGKGRVARALAQKTGRMCVDTDDLIETLLNVKIRTIFANQGESYFRQLEQQVADWLAQQVCQTVVSTGGGFFMVDRFSQLGQVVYLHAALPAIMAAIDAHPKRTKKLKKRPLLTDLEQAATLYNTRLPRYRALSDLEVEVTDRSIESIADEILAQTGWIISN